MQVKTKLVWGIGINDAAYVVKPTVEGKRVICPYYRVWRSMIERCYSSKFQTIHPTYVACTVSKDWLTFSNFKSWMVSQDWEGMQLDKDLLVPGNKIYSHSTCMFVTRESSGLIMGPSNSSSNNPRGVHYSKSRKRYKATLSKYGRSQHLGYFDTSEEAREAYVLAKIAYVTEVASKQQPKLKQALLNNLDVRLNKE